MNWLDVLALARRANDHYSMTEREQELLFELATSEVPENGLIVEVGVCWGKTAVVLASAAKKVGATYIGVDNWSLESSFSDVEEVLNDTVGYGEAWELFKSDSHGEHWKHTSPDVNFLVIDADHSNPGVGLDCAVWIPKVVPGGLVVFDDVPSGPGWETSAHAAVRTEMDKWTGDWENAASWGKVWVRRRPR